MKRDIAGLAAAQFDIAVVGAGIHGVCIARDAARRGFSVALIDRGDLGGETSHNSLKLVHGGFRYLQHLDMARLRQSAREQLAWLHTAPHLVRPLPFSIPAFGHSTRGPEAYRAALWAYTLATLDLVRGVPPEARLPPGRVLSRAQMQETTPGIDMTGVTGGVMWHDAQMLDSDRLLIECARDAVAHGAVVANHVAALHVRRAGDAITGVDAVDRESGDRMAIQARLTVNAAGPWAASLLAASDVPAGPLGGFAWNWNLVTRALPFTGAVGLQSRRRSDAVVHKAGRMFFVTPWRGVSVIGTAHEPFTGPPDKARLTEAEIEGFLAEVNEAYPAAELRRADVLYAYAGLTPGSGERRGEVRRAHRTQLLDHAAAQGLRGLISVEGIKYTTARAIAETVVDLVATRLDKRAADCSTRTARVPGGPVGDPPLDHDAFAAEVARAVADDMPVHLDDLILRRLPHAALRLMSLQRLDWAAATMGSIRGWSETRLRAELERTRRALERQGVQPEPRPTDARSAERPTLSALS